MNKFVFVCRWHWPHVAQRLHCLRWPLPRRTRSWTHSELVRPLALAACNQILDRSTGEAGRTQTRSPAPGWRRGMTAGQGRVQCAHVCLRNNSHHSVNANKVFWFLGPGRKLHVAYGHAIVAHPKLILITVHKHLRQVVEFRNQLLMGKKIGIIWTKWTLLLNNYWFCKTVNWAIAPFFNGYLNCSLYAPSN